MNRKLIERVLLKKHLDFVASIKDEKVQKLVNKNSIITGGSIVSLLTNQPVNDFDYYFRNYETTKAVAEYYIKEFCELNPNADIKPVLSYYPEEAGNQRVKIIVKSAGIASEKTNEGKYQYFEALPDEVGMEYVEKAMDGIDNIVADQEAIDEAAKTPYRPIFLSSNAITLSNKVQLVVRFYGDPDEIHKNYDYIHCCNYWTSDKGELVLNAGALESILTKNLQYQGSLYPVCSVIRMRKFLKQGWYINAGQIMKMLFQVSALDLTDITVLEDQLTGVDAAYFHQVIDYCKKKQEENPDFKVTMPYLISILDKVFG